ncbi:MAG: tetratricopeptide repeat protein, partial [Bacteroidia bacterium]|nr:tetratricopeptide repeat protein [Bacteroidia bacterium]
MKRILLIITTVLIYLSANAQSPKEMWTEANNNYSQANYQAALEGFLKIEKSGYVSSALFYNIGNAYFKMKEVGKSILYYERALKLDPADKDVINNLQLARDFSLDKIEEIPDFILKTWIKEVNYSLSSDAWAYLSI